MRNRHPKRWHLGAGPSQGTIDQYNSQLDYYKTLLVDAFKKRTLAFASRESTRFKFFTVWRAKFESLVSAIYVKIYADKNVDAVNLFGFYMSVIRSTIPLLAMDGSVLGSGPGGFLQKGDYAFNVNAPWRATDKISLFAPLENFMSNNYLDTGHPFYVESPNYYSGKSGQVSVASTLKNYFLTRAYGNIPFSLPPTLEWTQYVMAWDGVSQSSLSSYDYVASLFSMSFDGQSLISVLGEAKDYVSDLTSKTIIAVQAQQNIDSIKDQAAQFLASYNSEMMVPISVDDLLAQAEYDANNPPKPSAQLPVEPPVNSVVTTPVKLPPANIDPGIIAPSEIPKKSKLPLYAAAAVGAFLFLRKT